MIEEVTQDHVPVVPIYARSAAQHMRDAYDLPSAWTDPPIDIEQTLRPLSVSILPDLMSWDDALAADVQLCRALRARLSLKPATCNPCKGL